jgi:protein TonB
MFEQSVGRRQTGRKRVPLLVAAAVHAAGLATVLVASAWSIDEVPPPEVTEIFHVSLAPPDLGGGSPPPEKERPPQPPQQTQPQKAPEETQPPTVSPALPPEEVAPPATPTTDGPFDPTATTGDGPVNPDGVPWGIPGSDGDANTVADDTPIKLDARMTQPETIRRVQPLYTEPARKAGRQGVVILQATIDRTGVVTDVRLVKGLGMGLDESAVSAVRQWRFRPATLGGRPVPVYFQLTVRFTIQ